MTAETQQAPAAATPVAGAGTTFPTNGAGAGAKAAKAKAKRPSKPVVTKTAKPAAKAKTAKKPVKKAKAKAITGNRLVPADLTKYHVDKDKKTANGHPSVDCNDKVASILRGKDLKSVYELVANKVEDETVASLKKKYGHLNVGMQRMNLGNKLRGVLNAK